MKILQVAFLLLFISFLFSGDSIAELWQSCKVNHISVIPLLFQYTIQKVQNTVRKWQRCFCSDVILVFSEF